MLKKSQKILSLSSYSHTVDHHANADSISAPQHRKQTKPDRVLPMIKLFGYCSLRGNMYRLWFLQPQRDSPPAAS